MIRESKLSKFVTQRTPVEIMFTVSFGGFLVNSVTQNDGPDLGELQKGTEF